MRRLSPVDVGVPAVQCKQHQCVSLRSSASLTATAAEMRNSLSCRGAWGGTHTNFLSIVDAAPQATMRPFHICKLLRKLVTESLVTFGTFYFMHMIWNNGFRLGWPFTENLPLLKFSFDLRFNFKRHSGIYLVVSTRFLLHNRSLPLAEISGRHLLPTNSLPFYYFQTGRRREKARARRRRACAHRRREFMLQGCIFF